MFFIFSPSEHKMASSGSWIAGPVMSGVNVLMDVSDLHADDVVAMATFSFTGKKAHLLS